MTVKGRILTRRQHRVGGRLDPDVHGVRFYPTAPVPKPPEPAEPKRAELPGRPGAAERMMVVEWLAGGLTIAMHGWTSDVASLNPRKIAFLRDTLNDWFPPQDD